MSTRCETFEKGAEFRFLANFAVRLYRLFAKNEKRQKRRGFDVRGAFQFV